jgi:hypothetical protein
MAVTKKLLKMKIKRELFKLSFCKHFKKFLLQNLECTYYLCTANSLILMGYFDNNVSFGLIRVNLNKFF